MVKTEEFNFQKLFENAQQFFTKGKDKDIIYPPKTRLEQFSFIKELIKKRKL